MFRMVVKGFVVNRNQVNSRLQHKKDSSVAFFCSLCWHLLVCLSNVCVCVLVCVVVCGVTWPDICLDTAGVIAHWVFTVGWHKCTDTRPQAHWCSKHLWCSGWFSSHSQDFYHHESLKSLIQQKSNISMFNTSVETPCDLLVAHNKQFECVTSGCVQGSNNKGISWIIWNYTNEICLLCCSISKTRS